MQSSQNIPTEEMVMKGESSIAVERLQPCDSAVERSDLGRTEHTA